MSRPLTRPSDSPRRVMEMRDLRGAGWKLREIGDAYGVSYQTVSSLLSRETRCSPEERRAIRLVSLAKARAVNAQRPKQTAEQRAAAKRALDRAYRQKAKLRRQAERERATAAGAPMVRSPAQEVYVREKAAAAVRVERIHAEAMADAKREFDRYFDRQQHVGRGGRPRGQSILVGRDPANALVEALERSER